MKNLDFLTTSLIAHRGFFDNEKGIPENSMLAFQRAIQNHYNIELDVHILKDGKIVVFHDDHLKRMTNLDTAIKDCTYDDVKNLNLLNTNEKIPLLQEVLDFVAGKVTILIELKYDTKVGLLEKELVKILQNYKGQYAVQSFRPICYLIILQSQILFLMTYIPLTKFCLKFQKTPKFLLGPFEKSRHLKNMSKFVII